MKQQDFMNNIVLLQAQVPQAGNASVGCDMELGLAGSVSRVENTDERDPA